MDKGHTNTNIMVSDFYNELNQSNQIKLRKSEQKLLYIQILRLSVFIGLVTFLILYLSISGDYIYYAIICFLAFVYLINTYRKLEKRNSYFKRIDVVVQRELKLINNDYQNMKTSKNDIHLNHPFAYDLDVLGENSLLSRINRTSSQVSENLLTDSITRLDKNIQNILNRQYSIKKLAQQPVLNIEFNAIAL